MKYSLILMVGLLSAKLGMAQAAPTPCQAYISVAADLQAQVNDLRSQIAALKASMAVPVSLPPVVTYSQATGCGQAVSACGSAVSADACGQAAGSCGSAQAGACGAAQSGGCGGSGIGSGRGFPVLRFFFRGRRGGC